MPIESTHFAPAERASKDRLCSQIDIIKNRLLSEDIGDSLPVICLILNSNRQIVYANRRVLESLSLQDLSSVYGKRPGELFKCVHATEEAGGCGTSRYCENCGAIQAILGSKRGKQTTMECRLTQEGGISSDFEITATPILRDGESFTVFTMQDIQHEKRRQALERVFFHDILNTAGGVSGLVEVFNLVVQESEKTEILDLLKKASRQLIDEINSGRALSQAEDGNLEPELIEHDLLELASDTIAMYRNHPACLNRLLSLNAGAERINLMTDSSLVHRIVGNLVKNALEASAEGTRVEVDVRRQSEWAVVSVRNESAMTDKVKQQVFERSFSTKGVGRGLGTYSVKLFAEKYLQGRVWFESETGTGTVFHVALPVHLS